MSRSSGRKSSNPSCSSTGSDTGPLSRASTSEETDVDVTPEVFPSLKRGRPDGDVKHPVHELFNFHKERNISMCLLDKCKKQEQPGKHAGNLMAHLKSCHKLVYKNVLAAREKQLEEAAGGLKRPKVVPCVLNGVKMSAPALQLHCIRLVTEHGLPFKALDYAAFQDIVCPLLDAMPGSDRVVISSRTVQPKIAGFAEMVRERIRGECADRMLSLKVDGCSRGHRHFVGINVQFGLASKPTVRTLAVEELHDASTAQNLKVLITIVLKKYRIQVSQLVAFTSDNGANYVLAGRLLGQDGVEEVSDPDDMFYPEDFSWIDADIELLQDTFAMQSVRCAAHTLQLAVDDALKAEVALQQTIKGVKKLAKYLLTDVPVRQLKASKLPLPRLDVCTRWGSTYDMVKSVVNLKNFLFYTLDWGTNNNQAQFNLTDEEWELMEDFLKDLRPVRRATAQLQKEDMTLGEFYAIWAGVKMGLEARPSSSLALNLLKAVEERSKSVSYRDRSRGDRVSPLFNYPGFNAAVFLDPRFIASLSPEQVQDGKDFLLDLWERRQRVMGPAVEEASDTNEEEVDDVEEVLEDGDDSDEEGAALFAKFLTKKNRERIAVTGAAPESGSTDARARQRAALRALLDEHDRSTVPLDAKADIFAYWEKKKLVHPELYELAMIVLTIPATQVSVERLFSALSFIVRPQRYFLSGEHIDDVTFLHANSALVKDVVDTLLKKESA